MTAKKPAVDVVGGRRCRSQGPARAAAAISTTAHWFQCGRLSRPESASMPPWASARRSITALRRIRATTTVRALHLAR